VFNISWKKISHMFAFMVLDINRENIETDDSKQEKNESNTAVFCGQ
jgi:hypothetical protein